MSARRETSKSRSDALGRAQGDTRVNTGASVCPYIDKSWPICANDGRGTVGLAPAGHKVPRHFPCHLLQPALQVGVGEAMGWGPWHPHRGSPWHPALHCSSTDGQLLFSPFPP